MLKDNLDEPVLALFVRFVPKEWSSWPCMRVEIYGKPASKSRDPCMKCDMSVVRKRMNGRITALKLHSLL